MFYSELEAPGFHQKADVLEKIKQVGKLIHRRKRYFKKMLNSAVEFDIWNELQVGGMMNSMRQRQWFYLGSSRKKRNVFVGFIH